MSPGVPHRSKCMTAGCAKETCAGELQVMLFPPRMMELMQPQSELPVSEPWRCCKEWQKFSFTVAAMEWTMDQALNRNQLSMVLMSLSTWLVAACWLQRHDERLGTCNETHSKDLSIRKAVAIFGFHKSMTREARRGERELSCRSLHWHHVQSKPGHSFTSPKSWMPQD